MQALRTVRLALLLAALAAAAHAQDKTGLRTALNDQKYDDTWIYEDLDAGYAAATKSGKPLLVCFSCVP